MAVARVHQREIVEVPFTSFFVTHIVNPFNVDDVFAHRNCFLRQPFFDDVFNQIVANIIDGVWE